MINVDSIIAQAASNPDARRAASALMLDLARAFEAASGSTAEVQALCAKLRQHGEAFGHAIVAGTALDPAFEAPPVMLRSTPLVELPPAVEPDMVAPPVITADETPTAKGKHHK